jgi:hypothetical protein
MYLQAIVPTIKSRFVIVHYHIFKNGGTTIEHVLEREFSARLATLHGPDSDSVLDGDDLLEFLEKNPEIAAVSSHHLRYPKPRCRRIVFFDCCFLRDPIERLYSSYSHFRRSLAGDLYSRWARSCNPRDFAARMIEAAPHQISNVQVNQLVNAGAFTRPATERDFDQAIAIVKDMAIPGLVEMFEESLVAAEYFLGPAFPNLRLEYSPQNVSASPRAMQIRSANEWRGIWGSDLYERLLRMNAFDLELVRRARIEILRRLDSVPRLPEKLAEFRLRCGRLAPQPRAVAASAGIQGRAPGESRAAGPKPCPQIF